MKYTDIRNIEELDAARRKVSARVERKGKEVLERWDDVRESYSAAGLIASGLKYVSGSIPFDRIVLYGIRALKQKLFCDFYTGKVRPRNHCATLYGRRGDKVL